MCACAGILKNISLVRIARVKTPAAVWIGADINTVIEDAAAENGESDAKLKGEKAPGEKEPATGDRKPEGRPAPLASSAQE